MMTENIGGHMPPTLVAFIHRIHPRPIGFAVLAAIRPKQGDEARDDVQHGWLNLQREEWHHTAEQFIVRYAPTHNLYVTVADYREVAQRNEANVLGVPWLYREADDVPLPDWFPPPSVVVETSPGRLHEWWQLVAPLDVPTAKRYLEAMADRSGLTHAAVDAARLLRLPGTPNHKHGGCMVRTLEDHPDRVYDLNAFAPILAAAPAPRTQRQQAGDDEEPILPGARRPALLSLAGAMRRHGADETNIAHALHAFNERRCEPPLEVDEVNDLARDIAHRYPEEREAVRKREADSNHTDEDDGGAAGEKKGKGPTQSALLVALTDGADLFHDAGGEGYATITVNGHRETHVMRQQAYRRWLVGQYYTRYASVPGSQAVQDALGILAARAHYDGEERAVFVRLAEHEGRVYLDLCNPAWQAVEIDTDGWRVVDAPPVRFKRTKGMASLPTPVSGGSIAALRPFLNLAGDDAFVLVIAWLMATFRARGPYPILNIHGEQGSAKTTTARVLRSLVDPHTVPIRALPKEERDLMITATNTWLPVYDNVSGLPGWLSDALCRLATGGGYATRALYENDEETILDAQRPVILTGIDGIGGRSDYLDRSIIIDLPRIPEDHRRTERAIWREWETARPAILGALLTAVSGGLRDLPTVALSNHPRMADFAEWATATERACGFAPRAFMRAYTTERENAHAAAIEASPIGAAVLHFMDTFTAPWTGTASDLLAALNKCVGDDVRRHTGWPKSGRALATELRRIAPNLRETQVFVTFLPKGAKGKRLLRVERAGEPPPPAPPTDGVPRADVPRAGGDASASTATPRPQSPPYRHPSPPVPPPVFGLWEQENRAKGGEGGDKPSYGSAHYRRVDAPDMQMLTNWCEQVRGTAGVPAFIPRGVRAVAIRCDIAARDDETPTTFADRLAGWLEARARDAA